MSGNEQSPGREVKLSNTATQRYSHIFFMFSILPNLQISKLRDFLDNKYRYRKTAWTSAMY